jgi:SAM-dependent methyltransferase
LSRFINNGRDLKLSRVLLRDALKVYGVNDWYLTMMYDIWWFRWYVREPLFWLERELPEKTTPIYDSGCGCGLSLFWLAQRSFNNLYGSDIAEEAIQAGLYMAEKMEYNITLWQDDGINPARLPKNIGAFLALNWTYYSYVKGFVLEDFFRKYSESLYKRGYFIIDVIDSAWNLVPNNEYATPDWNKPVEERAPSEYAVRYSYEQVKNAADMVGMDIVHTISHSSEIIPRVVYCLKRR